MDASLKNRALRPPILDGTNTDFLPERNCFQVNPLGVATGVARPGRNTVQKTVCLNAATLDEECDDLYEEEITVESVQKLYEELYVDWIHKCKMNLLLSKENTDLKVSVSRLEVLLTKKDLELNTAKIELEKVNQTLERMNLSTSNLDSILMMGRDGKSDLGQCESTFETGECSKTPVFVKESKATIGQPKTVRVPHEPQQEKKVNPQGYHRSRRHFICHYCLKPGHIKPYCFKLRQDCMNWENITCCPRCCPTPGTTWDTNVLTGKL